ncbi:MAG: SgcJ/EcaC family oxidoreductase [Acidobacteria bacterium]|nr:SgcJ/EcaC family oxidoreductase [Acidobacteriota bacterium]
MSLFAVMLLCVAPGAAAQSTAPAGVDDRALRDLVQGLVPLWKQADARGIASRWAPDGDVMVSDGSTAKGRGEIEKWFSTQLSGVYKGTRLTATVAAIRMVTPTVAILDGDWEIAGIQAPGGASGSRKGKLTIVATKINGQWLMSAWRSMVPARPGATTS